MNYLSALPANAADYGIYAAIALVTLIGLIKCLLPLWTTTRCLRRAVRRLQKNVDVPREKPVWQ